MKTMLINTTNKAAKTIMNVKKISGSSIYAKPDFSKALTPAHAQIWRAKKEL